MQAFLLIVLLVILVLILAVNIYTLVYYSHNEESGFGITLFPRIVVILGLTLSWGMVFMFPFDVSNTRGSGGGFDMDVFWDIAIIATAVMLVILIPYALYYYESGDNQNQKQRVKITSAYTILYLILFCILFFVSYKYLGVTEFPIQQQTTTILNDSTTPIGNIDTLVASVKKTQSTVNTDVTISVYLMTFLSFFGWIFLVFFGGMGLFSIPLDLIHGYSEQPKQRSAQEIMLKKTDLSQEIAKLLDEGKGIEDSQKEVESARGFFATQRARGKFNTRVNKFKASVLKLENNFDTFASEVNYKNIEPARYTSKLIEGILLLGVSFLWWIHTLLGILTDSQGYPVSLFLNEALIFLDEKEGVTFVGVGVLVGLCIFLMVSVVQGYVKFGMRIPFFFTIHPMRKNQTLMNSFLFNVWFLLISCVASVQFLTDTFPQYARLSSAEFFFGTQVKYMRFFRYFFAYDVFEWAFLGWSIISLVVLCVGTARDKKGVVIVTESRNEIVL